MGNLELAYWVCRPQHLAVDGATEGDAERVAGGGDHEAHHELSHLDPRRGEAPVVATPTLPARHGAHI